MRFTIGICALGIVVVSGGRADGALLKASGSKTTTTAVKTTTSGQRTITCTIDPVNITSFQLDFQYDADKVELLSVTGINGYVVKGYDDNVFACPGSHEGVVENINGVYCPPESSPGALPGDMVELVFLDLALDRDKGFRTFFSDDADFLSGFDADTGLPLTLTGSQLFGAQSFAQVEGEPGPVTNGPGTGPVPVTAPLPGALGMGLVAGLGVVGNALRRRKV